MTDTTCVIHVDADTCIRCATHGPIRHVDTSDTWPDLATSIGNHLARHGIASGPAQLCDYVSSEVITLIEQRTPDA